MIGSATSSDDEGFIDAFATQLRVDQEQFKPLSIGEKMRIVATYVAGLVHIIKTGVVHGDLKPSNMLWQRNKKALEQETKVVISDFGGSKIVAESVRKMNKTFILEDEAHKNRMSVVVKELYKANINMKFLEKKVPEVEQLIRWGILTQEKKSEPPTICNQKKLDELKAYLGSSFLPAKTEAYECAEYTTAACHYFWRCDEGNFKNALHALDIRASGLTIYRIFTANDTPTSKTDNKAYYDTLQLALEAKKISRKAISIIRRMAEPMQLDLTQVRAFCLPVQIEELEALQSELSHF